MTHAAEKQSATATIRHEGLIVLVLLMTQAALLAYSATRHSPTQLEPAFVASGLSHWNFGRFELYRVNPPLPRMIATLPLLFYPHKTDWSGYLEGPGSRSEYDVGDSFVKVNGPASLPLFFLARWACIPFSLLGAYFAFHWAKELYGSTSGFITLVLYIFEPNLLSHGELVTPDSACTAFGILAGYKFWQWLKNPTWRTAILAGGALGLAELSKFSWLLLFGIWPMLWGFWRLIQWRDRSGNLKGCDIESSHRRAALSPTPSIAQLVIVLTLGVYLVNLGYAFEGTGTPLGEFQFVSSTLSGDEKHLSSGNRFRDSWSGELRIPLPRQFVLGVDSQKRDFEEYGQKSYLCGEWRKGGWWYYYLYGLMVKVPCGTWGLLAIIIIWRVVLNPVSSVRRDEVILLAPALALLVLVSSQTEFNIHLRYVFPSLGLFLIFLGQSGNLLLQKSRLTKFLVSSLVLYSVLSGVSNYPHHFSYFNDFVGGSKNGYKHLLGSSYDWGQDWLFVSRQSRDNETTLIIQQAPTDYTHIFPKMKALSLDELRSGGHTSTAIASMTEELVKAIAANQVVVVKSTLTFVEVKMENENPGLGGKR